MITPPGMSRRRFFINSSLAMAAMATRPAAPAVTIATARVVFDPTIAESTRFASTARRHGHDCRPLTGDRYRFALELIAVANPSRPIAGMTSYADFLLLSGTLQEARYRLIGHDLTGVTQQASASVSWLMQPRSARS